MKLTVAVLFILGASNFGNGMCKFIWAVMGTCVSNNWIGEFEFESELRVGLS